MSEREREVVNRKLLGRLDKEASERRREMVERPTFARPVKNKGRKRGREVIEGESSELTSANVYTLKGGREVAECGLAKNIEVKMSERRREVA